MCVSQMCMHTGATRQILTTIARTHLRSPFTYKYISSTHARHDRNVITHACTHTHWRSRSRSQTGPTCIQSRVYHRRRRRCRLIFRVYWYILFRYPTYSHTHLRACSDRTHALTRTQIRNDTHTHTHINLFCCTNESRNYSVIAHARERSSSNDHYNAAVQPCRAPKKWLAGAPSSRRLSGIAGKCHTVRDIHMHMHANSERAFTVCMHAYSGTCTQRKQKHTLSVKTSLYESILYSQGICMERQQKSLVC